jgi:glutamine phosphoribosylpyrophosphate amidotransferase
LLFEFVYLPPRFVIEGDFRPEARQRAGKFYERASREADVVVGVPIPHRRAIAIPKNPAFYVVDFFKNRYCRTFIHPPRWSGKI